MGPNVVVPTFSYRDKASHFPFMKLPAGKSISPYATSIDAELILHATLTEIRVEIYRYLLIAIASWPKDVKLEKNISRGVVLLIMSIEREDGKIEVKCKRNISAISCCPGI